MSYCRCGDDSDVYAYCGGRYYMIHVGDPHGSARRSYTERTPAKFRARLLELRAEGLMVPQRAIDRIENEIAKRASVTVNGDSATVVQYKPCEICTTQSWCETHGCQCYPTEAMCCVDYPVCDCNSPPEPDNAPTLQPCGHPWKAQHDFKCILCSSPG